jgi:hypothetical protein
MLSQRLKRPVSPPLLSDSDLKEAFSWDPNLTPCHCSLALHDSPTVLSSC